jgi:hypothetical protein
MNLLTTTAAAAVEKRTVNIFKQMHFETLLNILHPLFTECGF